MTGRPRQIFLHLAGCAVFLTLPILFSPESLSLRAYLTNPPTQREIITYFLLVCAFYANYYAFIPRFYFRRGFLLFIVLNLVCLALIVFLPGLLQPSPGPFPAPFSNVAPQFPFPPAGQAHSPLPFPPGRFPPLMRFRDLGNRLFLFLVVLFLALLLKIRDRWIRAEEEKLHAELAYLKAQINPHFLFNTLNSIYAMALGRSDQTAGAIVRLSSMMRYVLLEAGREKVPLDQEIGHLTDYIELQQTRFEATLHIDKTITGLPDGKYIVPLLLIPFVENAFKYGVNPDTPSTITIRIGITDDELHFLVVNHKVAVLPPDHAPSGLGIDNTRRRLQMLYPGRHTLHIDDGKDTFSVSLSLKGISA